MQLGVNAGAAAAGAARNSGTDRVDCGDDLRLFQIVGTGSFGAVHLGYWRGKQVAIKIMHLPAHALGPGSHSHTLKLPAQHRQQTQQQQQQQQREHIGQHSSRPHMAMMEAVLSTGLHHPNVVQVYTYILSPLMSAGASQGSVGSSMALPVNGWLRQQQQEQQQGMDAGSGGDRAAAEDLDGSESVGQVTGRQLQLVMEYCDQVCWCWALFLLVYSPAVYFPADAAAPQCTCSSSGMLCEQLCPVRSCYTRMHKPCGNAVVCVQGTLRGALDRQALPRQSGGSKVAPSVVLALSHDIAAAMLHLHKEGIV
jgi:hypothetical protein